MNQHTKKKKENNETEIEKQEYVVDSKFKKNEGELSEELNESNEDIKIKEHIFKKKSSSNDFLSVTEKTNKNPSAI